MTVIAGGASLVGCESDRLTAPPPVITDRDGGDHECPESEPASGEACGLPGLWCDYQPCGGDGHPTVTAECGENEQWSLSYISCNPPPPDALEEEECGEEDEECGGEGED